MDDETIKKLRKIPIEKNTSLTKMIREFLKSVVDRHLSARERKVKDLQGSFKKLSQDMGGRKWSREQLHER